MGYDDRSRSRSPRRDQGKSRGSGKSEGVAGRWNERGFGFIKPNDGGDDVFCHVSAIQDGNCLAEGATVYFDKVYDDRKGKDRAENVTGGTTSNDRGGGGGRGGDRGYGGDRGGGGGGRSNACYDFQKGRCTRGSSCRFEHEGSGGGGGYGSDRGGDRGYDRGDRGGSRYNDRY
ncbi:hypothetical protein CEUSTIGMA_g14064.t1 [Chlamydomonas eustigma]|uniref:C3H1-type domain-containing protein n=1 Tax=Chlamydomonas eustigma TaxID=1157962 RepID=A0A250XUE5_9CHLO|nr:hypothetical protein CEUSTIGMA_g14064.t1 [Chlamydomonas eustigma]|eukprot:GAX86656.1 hypothetical protein CEUSTIGMA_g14064.t1 [Chlamydomonas eustigma]